MSPRLAEFFRRRGRWFAVAAALALLPKCVLCLAAYAGLGAALGLGGPELCGAGPNLPSPWSAALAIAGASLGIIQVVAAVHCRSRTVRTCSAQTFPPVRSLKI